MATKNKPPRNAFRSDKLDPVLRMASLLRQLDECRAEKCDGSCGLHNPSRIDMNVTTTVPYPVSWKNPETGYVRHL